MWTAVVATSVSNFLSLLLKSKYKLKLQRKWVWLWAGIYLVLKPERSWLIWEHACLRDTGMCSDCFPKATEGETLESNRCPEFQREEKVDHLAFWQKGLWRPQEQQLMYFPVLIPFINQQLLWAESPQFESSLSRDKILSPYLSNPCELVTQYQVLCLYCLI